MSNWSTHKDILTRLERLWNSGRLLSEQLHPTEQFPLRIPLKKPTSNELDSQFDKARHWVNQWQINSRRQGYTLEWKTLHHRVHGKNQLPVAVYIDSPEQAIKLLDKAAQSQQFNELSALILSAFPSLADWVQRKPHQLLAHAPNWERLLALMQWLKNHPRPGIYLRQIDLPDIHSKFIEQHRGLLTELLDQVLPDSQIDHATRGVRGFEQRYGFRSKPVLVRFRLLDRAQSIRGLQDLSIPLADFSQLNPPARRILIVENEITFLALPELSDTLAIFGRGYALDALADIPWLGDKAIDYWSDLDTHGFVMLNQLREHYPQTQSLLMDEVTLLAHRSQWGVEAKPAKHILKNLTAGEQTVYQGLIQHHWQKNLRLEQEFIGFEWIKKNLGT